MNLEVLRTSSSKDSTLGMLYDVTDPSSRRFMCFTLEDEHRDNKVMHETRIPSGTYNITLRKFGGFHNRYKDIFRDVHVGMLWLRSVPGFTNILIHCGNTDDDTSGCLLLGSTQTSNVDGDGFVGSSRHAYRKVYSEVSERILDKEEVKITYVDFA